MNPIRIGKTTLKISPLAYGCWRIAGGWEARKVTAKARETGVKALLAKGHLQIVDHSVRVLN